MSAALSITVTVEPSAALLAAIERLVSSIAELRAPPRDPACVHAPDVPATAAVSPAVAGDFLDVSSQTAPAARVTNSRPAAFGERIWTEERKAVLRRDWPAGRNVQAIFDDLCALPGAPVPSATRVGIQAAQMGLRRPAAASVASAASLDPIMTDRETALRWGAERGMDAHVLDLAAVNGKRRALGLRLFEVPGKQPMNGSR